MQLEPVSQALDETQYFEEMLLKGYRVLGAMDQKLPVFGRGLNRVEQRDKAEVLQFLELVKRRYAGEVGGRIWIGDAEKREEFRLSFEFLVVFFARRSREWERRVFNGMVNIEVFTEAEVEMLVDLFRNFRRVSQGCVPQTLLNDRIAFVGRTMDHELGSQLFSNVFRSGFLGSGFEYGTLHREILFNVVQTQGATLFAGDLALGSASGFKPFVELKVGDAGVTLQEEEAADECPICMETMKAGDAVVKPKECAHVFCLKCFNKSRETSYEKLEDHRCALCRAVTETRSELCLK